MRACSRFIHSIARPHLYRKKKSSALCTHDNNVVMQNVQQFVYTALTNPMDVTFSMRLKMLFHFALLSFYQHVLCIQNNIFIGSIHNPPVSCFVIREERHGVHVCANVFFGVLFPGNLLSRFCNCHANAYIIKYFCQN